LAAYSLLLRPSDVSFLLKEKVLIWSVDLRGREHVYMLGLLTQIFNLLYSLLEEKVLILKVFSLGEKKFALRENLNGRLGSL